MDTENYISPSKITKQYDITSGTLRRWSEAGKIRCLRPNGGKRIYNIDDINKIFSNQKENENDTNATNDISNNKVKDSIKVLKETIHKKSEKEDYKDFIDFLETELQDVQNLIANMKVKK